MIRSTVTSPPVVEIIPLSDRLMHPDLPGPTHFCRPTWPSFMADTIVKEKVGEMQNIFIVVADWAIYHVYYNIEPVSFEVEFLGRHILQFLNLLTARKTFYEFNSFFTISGFPILIFPYRSIIFFSSYVSSLPSPLFHFPFSLSYIGLFRSIRMIWNSAPLSLPRTCRHAYPGSTDVGAELAGEAVSWWIDFRYDLIGFCFVHYFFSFYCCKKLYTHHGSIFLIFLSFSFSFPSDIRHTFRGNK